MSRPVSDVIAEDRLLWEFWLNHGLDSESLRRRLDELPPAANGSYLALNALYGCFETALAQLAEAGPSGAARPRAIAEALGRVDEGPHPRVSLDTPEGRLLALLSLRPSEGSEAAAGAVEEASRVTCWAAFVRAAGRSNLVPAVVTALERCGLRERFPEGPLRVLREAAEGIRARNRRLLSLLARLLEAFAARGLSPVLLKETALQGDLYRGEGDRMIGDLDILFPASEVDEAERLLVSMGYTSFEGIWSRAWYREHHHHLAPLVSPSEAVKIEPHTGIWIPTGPSAPVIPEMIAGSRPHPSLRARRPSTTHLLFHLLVDLHGNASVGKLGQAADAAGLLQAEGKHIDTGALTDLARRTGAIPFIEDSLFILARAYGEEFLDRAAPSLRPLRAAGTPTLERRVLRRLALSTLCGFEPRASTLSLAGLRLVHKALLRPSGRTARAAFLIRSAFGSSGGEEGMGALARQTRATRAGMLARAAVFPFRFAFRALRARRQRV